MIGMRYFTAIGLFLLFTFPVLAQGWTPMQLAKANTAKDIELLTDMEKEVIMYINLCRLYPQEFLEYEVENYYGTSKYGNYLIRSPYRKSLMRTLNTMEPTTSLLFDEGAYFSAECFAKEHGKVGRVGHNRIRCEALNYAECCSYGMSTARDIVLQLLIDHDVPSLGHRRICLSSAYNVVGVSIQYHSRYGKCAVLDFDW